MPARGAVRIDCGQQTRSLSPHQQPISPAFPGPSGLAMGSGSISDPTTLVGRESIVAQRAVPQSEHFATAFLPHGIPTSLSLDEEHHLSRVEISADCQFPRGPPREGQPHVMLQLPSLAALVQFPSLSRQRKHPS
jgi:hypothetical protein